MRNTVTFVCREKDEPFAIQLEPEAFVFKLIPKNEITFVGNNSTGDFSWAMCFDRNGRCVQLFLDGTGIPEIEIYENGKLLDDWYKYI